MYINFLRMHIVLKALHTINALFSSKHASRTIQVVFKRTELFFRNKKVSPHLILPVTVSERHQIFCNG